MKKLLFLSLFLTACAGTVYHKNEAAPQYATIDGNNVKISGLIENIEQGGLKGDKARVTVLFDDKPMIQGYLNDDYAADIASENKRFATTCNALRKSKNWIEIRCIVFVDNVRTVTLSL